MLTSYNRYNLRPLHLQPLHLQPLQLQPMQPLHLQQQSLRNSLQQILPAAATACSLYGYSR
jgi:hypothetical protein